MIQNRRMELHDQMAARPNGHDLVRAIRRVERVGVLSVRVDPRWFAQGRGGVREARREADSGIVTHHEIRERGGLRGEYKAGYSQQQQTSFQHGTDLS